MKTKDIQCGVTYKNGGAGNTKRLVVEIGPYHKTNMPAPWFSDKPRPADGLVVKYIQTSGHDQSNAYLYLHSFAAWAGAAVVQDIAKFVAKLSADVEQDATADPLEGAVGFLVFDMKGDPVLCHEHTEAADIAGDVVTETGEPHRIYPLYAGEAIPVLE